MARKLQTHDERMEATTDWRLSHLELISWLFAQGEEAHPFLRSMQESVQKYGALTPKQTAAVEKWQHTGEQREQEQQERADATKNSPPLREGRYEMTGEILKTKFHVGRYSDGLKMTVRLDDGNTVWGSVPASLDREADDLHGYRVVFTATVKRADNDEHFGFFRKPSGARFAS